MSEELKQFNINIEDIEENNNLFDNIQKAIDELRKHTLTDEFEVVLNNNLIECKEKLTNFRTILGCRITYDNLDKDISFIVREDNKISYEELEQKLYKYKQVIDKIKEWLEEDLKQQYRDCGHRNNIIREVYDKLNELLEEIE